MSRQSFDKEASLQQLGPISQPLSSGGNNASVSATTLLPQRKTFGLSDQALGQVHSSSSWHFARDKDKEGRAQSSLRDESSRCRLSLDRGTGSFGKASADSGGSAPASASSPLQGSVAKAQPTTRPKKKLGIKTAFKQLLGKLKHDTPKHSSIQTEAQPSANSEQASVSSASDVRQASGVHKDERPSLFNFVASFTGSGSTSTNNTGRPASYASPLPIAMMSAIPPPSQASSWCEDGGHVNKAQLQQIMQDPSPHTTVQLQPMFGSVRNSNTVNSTNNNSNSEAAVRSFESDWDVLGGGHHSPSQGGPSQLTALGLTMAVDVDALPPGADDATARLARHAARAMPRSFSNVGDSPAAKATIQNSEVEQQLALGNNRHTAATASNPFPSVRQLQQAPAYGSHDLQNAAQQQHDNVDTSRSEGSNGWSKPLQPLSSEHGKVQGAGPWLLSHSASTGMAAALPSVASNRHADLVDELHTNSKPSMAAASDEDLTRRIAAIQEQVAALTEEDLLDPQKTSRKLQIAGLETNSSTGAGTAAGSGFYGAQAANAIAYSGSSLSPNGMPGTSIASPSVYAANLSPPNGVSQAASDWEPVPHRSSSPQLPQVVIPNHAMSADGHAAHAFPPFTYVAGPSASVGSLASDQMDSRGFLGSLQGRLGTGLSQVFNGQQLPSGVMITHSSSGGGIVERMASAQPQYVAMPGGLSQLMSVPEAQQELPDHESYSYETAAEQAQDSSLGMVSEFDGGRGSLPNMQAKVPGQPTTAAVYPATDALSNPLHIYAGGSNMPADLQGNVQKAGLPPPVLGQKVQKFSITEALTQFTNCVSAHNASNVVNPAVPSPIRNASSKMPGSSTQLTVSRPSSSSGLTTQPKQQPTTQWPEQQPAGSINDVQTTPSPAQLSASVDVSGSQQTNARAAGTSRPTPRGIMSSGSSTGGWPAADLQRQQQVSVAAAAALGQSGYLNSKLSSDGQQLGTLLSPFDPSRLGIVLVQSLNSSMSHLPSANASIIAGNSSAAYAGAMPPPSPQKPTLIPYSYTDRTSTASSALPSLSPSTAPGTESLFTGATIHSRTTHSSSQAGKRSQEGLGGPQFSAEALFAQLYNNMEVVAEEDHEVPPPTITGVSAAVQNSADTDKAGEPMVQLPPQPKVHPSQRRFSATALPTVGPTLVPEADLKLRQPHSVTNPVALDQVDAAGKRKSRARSASGYLLRTQLLRGLQRHATGLESLNENGGPPDLGRYNSDGSAGAGSWDGVPAKEVDSMAPLFSSLPGVVFSRSNTDSPPGTGINTGRHAGTPLRRGSMGPLEMLLHRTASDAKDSGVLDEPEGDPIAQHNQQLLAQQRAQMQQFVAAKLRSYATPGPTSSASHSKPSSGSTGGSSVVAPAPPVVPNLPENNQRMFAKPQLAATQTATQTVVWNTASEDANGLHMLSQSHSSDIRGSLKRAPGSNSSQQQLLASSGNVPRRHNQSTSTANQTAPFAISSLTSAASNASQLLDQNPGVAEDQLSGLVALLEPIRIDTNSRVGMQQLQALLQQQQASGSLPSDVWQMSTLKGSAGVPAGLQQNAMRHPTAKQEISGWPQPGSNPSSQPYIGMANSNMASRTNSGAYTFLLHQNAVGNGASRNPSNQTPLPFASGVSEPSGQNPSGVLDSGWCYQTASCVYGSAHNAQDMEEEIPDVVYDESGMLVSVPRPASDPPRILHEIHNDSSGDMSNDQQHPHGYMRSAIFTMDMPYRQQANQLRHRTAFGSDHNAHNGQQLGSQSWSSQHAATGSAVASPAQNSFLSRVPYLELLLVAGGGLVVLFNGLVMLYVLMTMRQMGGSNT